MNQRDHFSKMGKGFGWAQAVAEADRCLLCHDAPCSAGCPARTQPAEFIRKLRFKNISGAIRTIKQNNILGGACGVLCPTQILCEERCSARFASENRPEGVDRPIQIGQIQRFLIEHAWQRGFKVFGKPRSRPEKVAIVGSGPGGLSCAAQLARDGYQTTVFEARPEPGGVLRYGVVPYRFDLDFLEHELEDISGLGVTFQCNTPIQGRGGAEKLLQKGYDAVFLAPGLWEATSLSPNVGHTEGLLSSVAYLESLRDGRLDEVVRTIEGKAVAVIGGGSVAIDCAESAVRFGAGDVYLIYRRSYRQMPADAEERIAAQEAGIHFLLLNQPVDYLTAAQKGMQGVKLVRTRLGEPDSSGRRRPESIAGSEWVLQVDLVIEAIGNRAPEVARDWYPHVAVHENGLIKVEPETGKTTAPGIFAGGDIVRGPGLVVQAVQDGKIAARAIKAYLNG